MAANYAAGISLRSEDRILNFKTFLKRNRFFGFGQPISASAASSKHLGGFGNFNILAGSMSQGHAKLRGCPKNSGIYQSEKTVKHPVSVSGSS